MCEAALSRCRSAWRFSRSAWASETVFVVLETAAGVHEVLANGFPALPLRLTFRGRLELPVKVENMTTDEGTVFVPPKAVWQGGPGGEFWVCACSANKS